MADDTGKAKTNDTTGNKADNGIDRKGAKRAKTLVRGVNLLAAMGISNYRIVDRDKVPKFFKLYDMVWIHPAVIGVIHREKMLKGVTLSRLALSTINKNSARCKSNFRSAQKMRADGKFASFITACAGEKKGMSRFFLKKEKDGHILIFVLSTDVEPNDAEREIIRKVEAYFLKPTATSPSEILE